MANSNRLKQYIPGFRNLCIPTFSDNMIYCKLALVSVSSDSESSATSASCSK